MSASVEYEPSGVVTVRVSGLLNSAEWTSAQQEVSSSLQKGQAVSLLVIADKFLGWEQGDWDDMSFQLKHDHQIQRVAVVAENKWEDEMVLFAGKGFRKFQIEFFAPSELAKAREWLSQSSTERVP
jgi:hypothetical protein